MDVDGSETSENALKKKEPQQTPTNEDNETSSEVDRASCQCALSSTDYQNCDSTEFDYRYAKHNFANESATLNEFIESGKEQEKFINMLLNEQARSNKKMMANFRSMFQLKSQSKDNEYLQRLRSNWDADSDLLMSYRGSENGNFNNNSNENTNITNNSTKRSKSSKSSKSNDQSSLSQKVTKDSGNPTTDSIKVSFGTDRTQEDNETNSNTSSTSSLINNRGSMATISSEDEFSECSNSMGEKEKMGKNSQLEIQKADSGIPQSMNNPSSFNNIKRKSVSSFAKTSSNKEYGKPCNEFEQQEIIEEETPVNKQTQYDYDYKNKGCSPDSSIGSSERQTNELFEKKSKTIEFILDFHDYMNMTGVDLKATDRNVRYLLEGDNLLKVLNEYQRREGGSKQRLRNSSSPPNLLDEPSKTNQKQFYDQNLTQNPLETRIRRHTGGYISIKEKMARREALGLPKKYVPRVIHKRPRKMLKNPHLKKSISTENVIVKLKNQSGNVSNGGRDRYRSRNRSNSKNQYLEADLLTSKLKLISQTTGLNQLHDNEPISKSSEQHLALAEFASSRSENSSCPIPRPEKYQLELSQSDKKMLLNEIFAYNSSTNKQTDKSCPIPNTDKSLSARSLTRKLKILDYDLANLEESGIINNLLQKVIRRNIAMDIESKLLTGNIKNQKKVALGNSGSSSLSSGGEEMTNAIAAAREVSTAKQSSRS